MKKILLGLFLILGVVSFSAPNHVNINKIENDGGMGLIDQSNIYSFAKVVNGQSVLAITYYVGAADKAGIKGVSESLKQQQLVDGVEYLGSGESEAGYIHKLYAQDDDYYFYIVIGKNQKVKNYIITAILKTEEDYSSKSELKNIINLAVSEGEKYLK